MAHKLSEAAQEDIQEAGEEAGSEEGSMAEELEVESSEPLPPAPETPNELMYRLGAMEECMRNQEARMARMLSLMEAQEKELAEVKEEEEDLEEVAVGEAEESGECQKPNPPAWCHLLAGQKRR